MKHRLDVGPSEYADASQMTIAAAQEKTIVIRLFIIQTELEITQ